MHMASSLNSGLSCPGLSPGGGHYVRLCERHLTLDSHITSPHPGVQIWKPANLMLWVTLRWTSMSIENTPKHVS